MDHAASLSVSQASGIVVQKWFKIRITSPCSGSLIYCPATEHPQKETVSLSPVFCHQHLYNFTFSLPEQHPSTQRVVLWRRAMELKYKFSSITLDWCESVLKVASPVQACPSCVLGSPYVPVVYDTSTTGFFLVKAHLLFTVSMSKYIIPALEIRLNFGYSAAGILVSVYSVCSSDSLCVETSPKSPTCDRHDLLYELHADHFIGHMVAGP